LVQKQAIRRDLHPQLARLWTQLPLGDHAKYLNHPPEENELSVIKVVAPFKFASIVATGLRLLAELDILLLRPQAAGALLGHSGDLDNRVKTLLDALRIPTAGEIPAADTPGPAESPFHCLLEDDALVSRLAIETDRWLEDVPANHVSLVIKITTRPTVGTWGNIGLLG
jgi:hypothetical protein